MPESVRTLLFEDRRLRCGPWEVEDAEIRTSVEPPAILEPAAGAGPGGPEGPGAAGRALNEDRRRMKENRFPPPPLLLRPISWELDADLPGRWGPCRAGRPMVRGLAGPGGGAAAVTVAAREGEEPRSPSCASVAVHVPSSLSLSREERSESE